MSWVGWRNFNIQWCRGGLRVAEKVSSKVRETNIPSLHKQMIMKYLEELLTLVALMAWFTYGYLVLMVMI